MRERRNFAVACPVLAKIRSQVHKEIGVDATRHNEWLPARDQGESAHIVRVFAPLAGHNPFATLETNPKASENR
jgi:hypothetical protein